MLQTWKVVHRPGQPSYVVVESRSDVHDLLQWVVPCVIRLLRGAV